MALQGASSSTASKCLPGSPRRGIRLNKVRLQVPMPQVLPEALQAHRVALNGDNRCAGRGKLRRLAARGGAEIRHALAGCAASSSGWQRGSGVLHPEFTEVKAWDLGDVGSGREAHRAGRQHDTVRQLARPA